MLLFLDRVGWRYVLLQRDPQEDGVKHAAVTQPGPEERSGMKLRSHSHSHSLHPVFSFRLFTRDPCNSPAVRADRAGANVQTGSDGSGVRADLRLGSEDPEALVRHGGGGRTLLSAGAHRKPALQPGRARHLRLARRYKPLPNLHFSFCL